MPTCRACGAQASDDARFCPTCGTYFAPPAAPPAPGAFGPPSPSAALPGSPAAARPRPLGITILAILNVVLGAFAVLAGLVLTAMGPALLADPPPEFREGFPPGFAAILPALGLLTLAIGAVMVLVGWGQWQGRGWAWTVSVVFYVVNLVLGFVTLPLGLLNLLVYGFLLWYFTRPGVKAWFARTTEAPGLPQYVPPPPSPPP